MPTVPAISARGVGKRYQLGSTQGMHRYRTVREDLLAGWLRRRSKSRPEPFWALRDIDFDISQGETVGIIGRNGAGKSTLLKILSRVTVPTEGSVRCNGRVGSLLEVGTGFHPELTGRENIFLSGAVLGMRRSEVNRKLDEIIEFSGVAPFLATPIKRYSSGMYLRLAFAVAAHLEPDVLIVDEVLAVGDADFQQKCLGRMADIGSSGRTVLFVSHNMAAVLRLCPRVMLLNEGRVIRDGSSTEVVRTYLDSGLGSAAERTWPRVEDAPGDDVARLKAVRVVAETGTVKEEIDITRPVGIQVEYWHLTSDPSVRPAVNLHFYNEDGLLLFLSNDFNNKKWWNTERKPGIVTATCWIPGNFLAEGRIRVLAAVSSLNPSIMHAGERDAVSFQVVDRTTGEGVRGEYANDWPGVIRPMLGWDVEVNPASSDQLSLGPR